MAKKNDFFDEEVVAETVESVEDTAAVEATEDAAVEAEAVVAEAPVEIDEPVAQTVEEAQEDVSEEVSDDTMSYEDVEDIIAIEEAEKKRLIKRIVSFVCLGVAVVGAVAVLYRLFFGKED